jgi:anaerobic ribonucleoside-triphosphate reductase
MAQVCNDCSLVWTLPKRWCPRCKSRDIRSTSQPFGRDHNLSANDDGQTREVLGPVADTPEQNDDI